jgi:hypothetical protein
MVRAKQDPTVQRNAVTVMMRQRAREPIAQKGVVELPKPQLTTADLILIVLHLCTEDDLFPSVIILLNELGTIRDRPTAGDDFFSADYLAHESGLEADVEALIVRDAIIRHPDNGLMVTMKGKSLALTYQPFAPTLIDAASLILRRMRPRQRLGPIGITHVK